MKFELFYNTESNSPRDPNNYRVHGSYVANTLEQHRDGSSPIPPSEGPGVSMFLNSTYLEFKRTVLKAVDERCVQEPLKSTVDDMMRELYPPANPVEGVTSEGWEI